MPILTLERRQLGYSESPAARIRTTVSFGLQSNKRQCIPFALAGEAQPLAPDVLPGVERSAADNNGFKVNLESKVLGNQAYHIFTPLANSIKTLNTTLIT
jgi:hypothetical protein